MNNSLIDLNELMEIMDHDKELIKECFNDFINDATPMLKKIKEAIDNGNSEVIQKTAHALKGSLRYLAAKHTSNTAFALEKIGLNGNLVEANATFDSLADECQQLIEWMKQYKFNEQKSDV